MKRRLSQYFISAIEKLKRAFSSEVDYLVALDHLLEKRRAYQETKQLMQSDFIDTLSETRLNELEKEIEIMLLPVNITEAEQILKKCK